MEIPKLDEAFSSLIRGKVVSVERSYSGIWVRIEERNTNGDMIATASILLPKEVPNGV